MVEAEPVAFVVLIALVDDTEVDNELVVLDPLTLVELGVLELEVVVLDVLVPGSYELVVLEPGVLVVDVVVVELP